MSSTNCLIGALSFPKGSAVNILGSYSIPHLASFVTEGIVGFRTWDIDTLGLGYLAETWLVTAAKEQGTDIDDAVPFMNVQSIAVTRNDLKQLNIAFSGPPKSGFSEGYIRPTGDYGYCQFQYADGGSPLIHISFGNTKLVPPRPNCTGANLWFNGKLSGSYVSIYNSVAAPKVICDTSHPVSPSTNVMTGVDFGEELSAVNSQFTDFGGFSTPTISAGIFSTYSNPQVTCVDTPTGFGTGQWRTVTLSMLSEIWQDRTQRETGEVSHSYSIPALESVNEGTLQYIKRGSLIVTAPTTGYPQLSWRFGIPNYGAWAPLYGTYCGPLHPLNQKTSILIPDYNQCTGFWIFLKKGCSGTLNTVEAANWTEPINTPSGDVNLAQGITDGLTWST